MIERKSEIIPKGNMFLMSSGCYSDYYIMGLFRAKEDVDVDALKAEYAKTHDLTQAPKWRTTRKDATWLRRKDFIEFIISKDLMERIPYHEFYTGDYGDVELSDIYATGPEAMFLGNNAGIETDYL